jgi:hypothetical protein
MESAVKDGQAMGMKGYVGDLAQVGGRGVMGPGGKEKPLLPHQPFIPLSRRGETRNPGAFSHPRERKSNPSG